MKHQKPKTKHQLKSKSKTPNLLEITSAPARSHGAGTTKGTELSLAVMELSSYARRRASLGFDVSKFVGVCCLVFGVLTTGCQNYGPRFNARKPAGTDPLAAALAVATNTTPLETVTLTNQVNPELLKLPTEPFTLGPGDKLEIELLDDPSSRAIVPVGPDGKIYYSFLSGIDVWGLTISQTKELIEKEFTRFLRERPHVGITVRAVESKQIWLLGRFQSPGVYPLAAPTTLLEALALAGGTVSFQGQLDPTQIAIGEEIADLRRAFVVRKGALVPVDFERLLKHGDISQNIYLQPDDFVYMPAATGREIYVIGAVGTPRAVPYRDDMNLVAAIAAAGGTHKESYLSHVAVVRGSWAQPKIAVVDYKAIARGQTPGIALEPRDIVYVPLKPYRHLYRYLNLIMDTFVTSVAINEGARAVTRTAAPTGVVIPLTQTAVSAPVTTGR